MIDLNTFILEDYNSSNEIHRNIINSLTEDTLSRNYISKDLNNFIDNLTNKSIEFKDDLIGTKVAYLKRSESNIPVGIIGLDKRDNKYFLFYSLLKEYRKEHIGLLLLQQYSYYLVDDLNLNNLYGVVDESNKASINNAESIGFEKVTDDTFTLKEIKR